MKKKRNLKGIGLNKKVISNLEATKSSGGLKPSMIRDDNGGIILVWTCYECEINPFTNGLC